MTPTIKDLLDLLDNHMQDKKEPIQTRLAAAMEYGCYRTLVDVGMLDETSNDYTIAGLKIERTDLTCVDMMDRAIEREERKQLNRDALLLEDDGFHGLAK